MEELEPRVLFSADLVPGLGEVEHEERLTGPVTESLLSSESAAGADADAVVVTAETRRELVFIDSQVSDYQTLVADLLADSGDGRSIEVVVLDSEQDGIEQIGEALGNYQGLDAVHIVSHGTDAGVQLGDTWFSQENLADYRDGIAAWADALSKDADLLFYGCNFAASEEKQGRTLYVN